MKKKGHTLETIKALLQPITISLFGQKLYVTTDVDKLYGKRVYLRVYYHSSCNKTGEIKMWEGRKWYLSPFMTDSEIVFTAYAAFEMAVKHEIMEGFKYDGNVLINPHIDFRKLLEVSPHEVERARIENFDV